MKVGEYCRNKYGIAKVIDIENNYGIDVLVFDKPICFLVDKTTGKIKEDKLFNQLALIDGIDLSKIKHSPKIIDLIEVGDYINGGKVIDIVKGFKAIIDKLELDTTTGLYHNIGITNIKSIVTKEQFESMEYKVKE